MARGRINGKKIHVEGFTPNDPENEEIYRVVAQGRSVAGGSDGLTVESNMATVVHEKHAEVIFGTPCHCDLEGCAPELCGCVRVHTKNIKRDTVVAVQVPGYVNQYVIERQTPTLYYLKYCLYPGYDTGIEMEPFILAGTDIYGNVIPSEKYWVNPVNVGQIYIDLREDMDVPASATSQVLNYTWHPDVVVSTITRYDIEGDIRDVIFTAPGIVTVIFPQNYSRTSNRTYRIRIIGRDRFGSVVKSNYVTLTQGKAGKDGQFYILGDDINYDQTEAVFTIHYASGTTGIGIVDYSPTITGILSSAVTSPGVITVTALTEMNTETSMKELTISATGLTNNGTEVYAEGLIYQLPGVFLLILGKCTGNKTGSLVNETTADIPLGNILNENDRNYCSRLLRVSQSIHEYGVDTGSTESEPTELYRTDGNSQGYEHYTGEPVFYYTQNETFKYTSYGVTGIMASGDTAFVAAGGRATVNTTSKTVSLTFSKNMTGIQRTFTITLYGRRSDNSVISATYTFTQMKQDGNVFTLQSGTTFESTVELPYTVTSISLKIRCPADYKDIGLAATTTSLSSYTIHNVRITKNADEEYTLNADLYSNNTPRSITYTAVVSGHTGDNRVRYTKTFGPGGVEHDEMTIVHKPYTSVGDYILISPDTVSVRGSENSYLVHFTFTSGITNIWVDMCQVTDGDRGVVSCTSPDMGNGTLTISFPANPPEGRTIKLRLGGMNVSNEAVMSNEFTLTQGSSGSGNVSINPQSITVGSQPTAFTYQVTYSGVQELVPIYNASVFSDVSNTGARILTTNTTLMDDVYQITFRGRRLSDNVIISTTLTVTQKKHTLEPTITVKSSSSNYNADIHAYVIYKDESSYPLSITTNDVQFESLRAFVSGDNPHVTANTISGRIYFGEVFDSASTQVYVTGLSDDGVTTVTSNTITFIQALEEGGGDDHARHITATTNVANTVLSVEPGGTVVDTQTLEEVGTTYFLGPIPRNYWISPPHWAVYYTASCPGYVTQHGIAASVMDLIMIEDSPNVMQDVSYELPWGGHYDYIHDGGTCDSNLIHLEVRSDGPFTATCINTNSWMSFAYGGGRSTITENAGTRLSDYLFYTDYNAGIYDRECTISVSTRDVTRSTTFTQPALSADFGVYIKDKGSSPSTAPASGGQVTFEFYYYGIKVTGSTGSVSIQPYYSSGEVSSVSTITVGLTDSTGVYGRATATLKPNNTGIARTVIITIHDQSPIIGAGVSGEIHITQAG